MGEFLRLVVDTKPGSVPVVQVVGILPGSAEGHFMVAQFVDKRASSWREGPHRDSANALVEAHLRKAASLERDTPTQPGLPSRRP